MRLMPKPGVGSVKDPITGLYIEGPVDLDSLPKEHAVALLRLHLVDGDLIPVPDTPVPEATSVKTKPEK